jgi:hypothetical protein
MELMAKQLFILIAKFLNKYPILKTGTVAYVVPKPYFSDG